VIICIPDAAVISERERERENKKEIDGRKCLAVWVANSTLMDAGCN
jgi:hypothetical protein